MSEEKTMSADNFIFNSRFALALTLGNLLYGTAKYRLSQLVDLAC